MCEIASIDWKREDGELVRRCRSRLTRASMEARLVAVTSSKEDGLWEKKKKKTKKAPGWRMTMLAVIERKRESGQLTRYPRRGPERRH